ncbi:MAG: sugar phosphate nucleotidyltransferase, partial [Candidatus Woesebacteria bacterium]
HGDVLTDLNLERLAKFHADEKPAASMVVKLRLAEKKYGKVVMQGNKIVEFVGATDDRGISVVNGGVYIFNSDIADYIPSKTPSYLEKDVFPALAKQGKLSAYIYQGICFDVSRPESYKKALKQWKGVKKGRG